MVDRVEVFVDTSYLLASFYNSWTTGARAQLEIDLPAVTNRINTLVSDKIHRPVHRQLWYDGIPDSGPHRYQRTLRHINGVQLRAGQLIEWGDRRTQKGVDTRLVADMVLRSVRGIVSDIVLVSGDADMIPGVEAAVEHGVRVHLVGFEWDSISNSLRSSCDTVTVLDPRDYFEDCMHIEVLDSFSHQEGESDGTYFPAGSAEGADSEQSADADNTQVSDADGTADADGATSSPSRTTRHRVNTYAAEDCTAHDAAIEANADMRHEQHAAADTCEIASQAARAEAADRDFTAPDRATASEETADAEPVTATRTRRRTSSSAGASSTSSAPGTSAVAEDDAPAVDAEPSSQPTRRPSPGMMAQKRRPLGQPRYVPLPYDEVWESASNQSPFDIGQQYAMWWYNNAATAEQRASAHILTGGGLPADIDRPLLQFACQTLDAYTLTDTQRVNLRDGFHIGIRGIIMGK